MHKIDENGYFLEDVVCDENEPCPEDCVDCVVQEGLYKPLWNGEAWVEGMSAEELLALITPQPTEPTNDDYLVDLDYRLSLMELGL